MKNNVQKIINKVRTLLKYHPDCGDVIMKGNIEVVFRANTTADFDMILDRIIFDHYDTVVVTEHKIEMHSHGVRKLFEYSGWDDLMVL